MLYLVIITVKTLRYLTEMVRVLKEINLLGLFPMENLSFIEGLERNSLIFHTRPMVKCWPVSSLILNFEATRSHRSMDKNFIGKVFDIFGCFKEESVLPDIFTVKCKVLGQ